MKKFRFPLQTVGVLRAHRERRAQEALAAALRARTEAEQRLAGARQRTAEIAADLAAARSGCFRPSVQAAGYEGYRRLRAAEAEAGRLAGVAAAEVAARREACAEAHRQVKVIDKVRTEAWRIHLQGALRGEQTELDEIAGHRAARRNLPP